MMNPYVAVVNECSNGNYYLFFPDIPECTVFSESLNESVKEAYTVLNTHINLYFQLTGKKVPKASLYSEIQSRYPDKILQLVPIDPLKDTTPVKKTLSIPKWLDELGRKYSLSPSKILKEAMVERLKKQNNLTEQEKLSLFAEV